MPLFWTFLSSFVLLTGLAYAALRLWGSVTGALEHSERSVYGESLASLASTPGAKPAVANLLLN